MESLSFPRMNTALYLNNPSFIFPPLNHISPSINSIQFVQCPHCATIIIPVHSVSNYNLPDNGFNVFVFLVYNPRTVRYARFQIPHALSIPVFTPFKLDFLCWDDNACVAVIWHSHVFLQPNVRFLAFFPFYHSSLLLHCKKLCCDRFH